VSGCAGCGKLFPETSELFKHGVFSRRRQKNGVLVVYRSGGLKIWMLRVLNGDCREQSERKLKVETAVGKVMASSFCYSEGIVGGIPSDVCRR
jgi:hypothetical protein